MARKPTVNPSKSKDRTSNSLPRFVALHLEVLDEMARWRRSPGLDGFATKVINLMRSLLSEDEKLIQMFLRQLQATNVKKAKNS